MSKKQNILLGNFILVLTFFNVEASRIVTFINNTKQPDPALIFSLTNPYGTVYKNLGSFKSTLDLETFTEIPKNSPISLEVKIAREAPSHAYDAGQRDNLKPNTTYSITRIPLKGTQAFEIAITPINK